MGFCRTPKRWVLWSDVVVIPTGLTHCSGILKPVTFETVKMLSTVKHPSFISLNAPGLGCTCTPFWWEEGSPACVSIEQGRSHLATLP